MAAGSAAAAEPFDDRGLKKDPFRREVRRGRGQVVAEQVLGNRNLRFRGSIHLFAQDRRDFVIVRLVDAVL